MNVHDDIEDNSMGENAMFLGEKNIKFEMEQQSEASNAIFHVNEHFLMTEFKKQGSQDNFIIILVPIISGAGNFRLSFLENDTIACIKYNWPKPMFEITTILRADNKGDIPKILALEKELAR